MDVMSLSRLVFLMALAGASVSVACAQALPEEGPLNGTSSKLAVTGEYTRVQVDAVDRLTLEGGKLVIHSPNSSVTLDVPAGADAQQKQPGWALVTEGEREDARSLSFTHEISLDDFSIDVPPSPGQVAYGTLSGKSGHDLLVFAYGSGGKCYWGWVDIGKK